MNKLMKNKGFTLIEIIVIVAIMIVLLAILAPSLLKYVENSRMQKDESAMDELCHSILLAMSDTQVFDEVVSYAIPNNYVTYTDSSGVYAAKYTDEEFWAPDGSGNGVTITFNPDENGTYVLANGRINNMTEGNGSVADSRTAEGLQQCVFSEMGQQKLYAQVSQNIGTNILEKSSTYKNSSYTVFITFDVVNGIKRADVYGEFNGTNLSPDCPASLGSGTTEYTPDNEAITTKPNGGTTQSNFSNLDLQGSGTSSPNDTPSPEPTLPPEPPKDPALNPVDIDFGEGRTTPNDSEIYKYGDYQYTYSAANGGWRFRILSNSKSTYGAILESINGYPVNSAINAFSGCKYLSVSPVIPDSVTNMTQTYMNCVNLRMPPEIPSGVTTMWSTFNECSALQEAPDLRQCTQLTNMYCTFLGCKAMKIAPVIPESVTNMECTFYNNIKLETYHGSTDSKGDFRNYQLPKNLTTLYATFTCCYIMTSPPTIPNNSVNISRMFMGCKALQYAPTIPEGITRISETFEDCAALKEAPVLPNSITSLTGTFDGCVSLTAPPVIPQGVTHITEAFKDCTGLLSAPVIPETVKYMAEAFSGCTKLQTIPNIPMGVINMNKTFYNCSSLTGDISLPCSLKVNNYTYTKCPANITYVHTSGCDGSCGA